MLNREFVADPAAVLSQSAQFFDVDLSEEAAASIARGPVFTTHSKQPGRQFSFQDHEKQIQSNRDVYRQEVDEGLAWANDLAQRIPFLLGPGKMLI